MSIWPKKRKSSDRAEIRKRIQEAKEDEATEVDLEYEETTDVIDIVLDEVAQDAKRQRKMTEEAIEALNRVSGTFRPPTTGPTEKVKINE